MYETTSPSATSSTFCIGRPPSKPERRFFLLVVRRHLVQNRVDLIQAGRDSFARVRAFYSERCMDALVSLCGHCRSRRAIEHETQDPQAWRRRIETFSKRA